MLSQITLLLTLFASLQATASVLCVKNNALGNGSGASWNHAIPDLQRALDLAKPGDQVWVSRQTITLPQEGFIWPREVAVYGGFSGHEMSKNDRKKDSYTILLRDTNSQSDFFVSDAKGSGRFIIDGFELVDKGNEPVLNAIVLSDEGDVIIDNLIASGLNVAHSLVHKSSNSGDVRIKACVWSGTSTSNAFFVISGDLLVEKCVFDALVYDHPLFKVSGEVIARDVHIDGVAWSEAAGPY